MTLPTLRPPSREPLWIRGSRFSNQQRRFSKSRLPWTAAVVDPRLQRGDASPRSTASSCAWFRPSLHCCKPAKWRAWLQLRNQMLERAGDIGSVVVSWTPLASSRSPTGPSRKSHGPYQGYPPPGCGTRPSAQCTGRWRCSIHGYKVAGVWQARQVTGAAALTSKGARIVSITVSHRTSNRTVSISTIRPQIWRAVWPKAELRCLQADNRTGGFDVSRYCSDSPQFPVYTAIPNKPFV